MDATQPPKKSDIIVSLGGGDGRRIQKALSLYQQGYSLSNNFVYTGYEIVNPALDTRFSKSEFLMRNSVQKEKIVAINNELIFNTVEELFFIKRYMQKHGYKSVLIVSSPVHTRRIKMLAKWIAGYDQSGITYTVTSFKQAGWQPSEYYQDTSQRQSVFLEFKKLIYNLIKYSPIFIDQTSYAKKYQSPLWKDALQTM